MRFGRFGSGRFAASRLNTRFVDRSATPPPPTGPTVRSVVSQATGSETARLSIDADPVGGIVHWYVSTSATPPGLATLKSGAGAVDSGSFTLAEVPQVTSGPSGLTASTSYHLHIVCSFDGQDSPVVSGSFITEAPDTIAPRLSNASVTVTGPTSADLSVETDEDRGTLYWYVGTSASAPSPASLKDGTGAVASGAITVNAGESEVSVPVGGLGQTVLHGYFLQSDPSGNDSDNGTSAGTGAFTPADVTAPVLSSHECDVSGSYGFDGVLNTDHDNGLLDIVLTASATTPTASQIKAGQDHTGSAALRHVQNQLVTAAGPQAYSGSDLDGGTTIFAHATHTDNAGNAALPITASESFTTAAATAPDAFAPEDWSLADAANGGRLTVMINILPSRNGADISHIEYRVDDGSWTSSGGIGSFTVAGLENDLSVDIEMRAVNGAGSGTVSDTKSATPTAGLPDAANVFSATWAGQSLAYGTGGAEPLGESAYNGLMLDTGMHTTLAGGTPGTNFATMDESLSQYDAGETGWADALAEIIETEDAVMIASQSQEAFVHNVAKGNTSAAGLLGRSESYTAFLTDLPAISAALTNGGKSLRTGVWPIVRRQGERDQIIGTDSALFRGLLVLEQTQRMSDLSREFGAAINPDIITYQFASHCDTGVGTGTPDIPLALLDLCREEGLPFYLSNPLYYLPHSDGVHLASVEYRRLGAAEALMGKRLYWDDLGASLEPLAIRAAWTSGNDVILRYGVENGRTLELDTTQVASQTNSGFELYESDGVTPITITGVSVTGVNEVTISTGSARSAGEVIRYAYSGDTDTAGPRNGPRGNLRDDTGDAHTFTVAGAPYRLDRWAAIDTFTVSGNSGEPPAWNSDPHAIKSLATMAGEYGLDGLFDLHTDADTARYNHGQSGSGLRTFANSGGAAFDSEGVTFASGAFIDTGIAEEHDFTLFLVTGQQNGGLNLLRCYTGGGISGSASTGLENVGYGFDYPRLWLKGAGSGKATVGPLIQASQLHTGPGVAIFGYTSPEVPNTGFDFSPRYPDEGSFGTESEAIGAGGARDVVGTNWIIGNSTAKIHFAAVKSGTLSYEEMCRLYRDAAYHLRQRGVYI